MLGHPSGLFPLEVAELSLSYPAAAQDLSGVGQGAKEDFRMLSGTF